MQALGRQILAEFYNCDSEALKNEKYIETAMVDACIKGKATVVTHTFHSFSPFGVSGVVVIAESHVAIHTNPLLSAEMALTSSCPSPFREL